METTTHAAGADDELPGALQAAINTARQVWPHSMDAAVWANKWLELTADKPREAFNDREWMISWFANAIMAGYDTAMQRASKWQLIESAPKTGPAHTIILWVPALHGTGGPVLAHWAYGGGEEQPAFGPAWFYSSGPHSFQELTMKPTHWTPLPPPPSAGGRGA